MDTETEFMLKSHLHSTPHLPFCLIYSYTPHVKKEETGIVISKRSLTIPGGGGKVLRCCVHAVREFVAVVEGRSPLNQGRGRSNDSSVFECV